jgi:hypothetical protein
MPESFTIQFFFNFSNFIGMKMRDREAKVNISQFRAETLGQQVITGSIGKSPDV